MTGVSALDLARSATERSVTPEALRDWLDAALAASPQRVAPCALDGLAGWGRDPASGDIVHDSGRFFAIRAIEDAALGVRQPIIDQPDVGVLGFAVASIDGVVRFLVQAKAEPGNARLVQLSPTVQATSSNYERVHGGRATPLIELFLGDEPHPARRTTVLDTLQPEQASRFLRKANRNMVVLVEPERLELDPGVFRWVTLGDLLATTAHADLLHMDARSVLGSLDVGHDATDTSDGRGRGVDEGAAHPLAALADWLEERGRRTPSAPRVLPLSALTDWSIRDGVLAGSGDHDFEVVGVDVESGSREVSRWSQPLVRNLPGRTSTLVLQRRAGRLHLLVQAARQVGAAEAVELLPSVLREPSGERPSGDETEQRRVEELADAGRVLREVDLPEEGGRFLHSSTRHVLVALEPGLDPTLDVGGPGVDGRGASGRGADGLGTFRWVTPHQLAILAAQPRRCSIELRSLLSCLEPALIEEGVA